MKNIKDFDLNNKKVIIRVDFNVPMKDGVITDDNRIVSSLETINYAINNGAKVILMSHLGRVKEESDKEKNTLLPVAEKLCKLLDKNVYFSHYTRGEKLESAINNLKPGEVLLMENTRYEDLDGKKESGNDPELGKYWASLGDIFINDAFGTCHRAHASNVGIASYLPSGVGFLVQKELDNMLPVINNPEYPFVVILGGAKVSDKIGIIENLIDKVDKILIGGGMAYTFLKAKGLNVGNSLVEEEKLDYCKDLLKKTNKIVLPIDHVCSKEIGGEAVTKGFLDKDDMGLDIGPETVSIFEAYIKSAKTIVWNGPLGVCENPLYTNGTIGVCKLLDKNNAKIIVGGGDTAAAVISLGYKDNVTHISTGGGASLELLEGKELPGVAIIGKVQ
jgi:phosphoglycerate kinase